MKYKDLEKYGNNLNFSLDDVVTIGWLDQSIDFPRGNVNEEILEKLKDIYLGNNQFDAKVNLMRHYSPCDSCGKLAHTRRNDEEIKLGACEIWIKSNSGKYFATPSTIIHHIEVHNYVPPDEFLSAVMSCQLNHPFNAQKELREMFKKAKERGLF